MTFWVDDDEQRGGGGGGYSGSGGNCGGDSSEGNYYSGGGGGSSTSPASTPEVDDKEIKGTKAGCVYDKLMNSSNDFNSIIQKFMGEKPINHLTFKIDYSLPNKTNARTKNLDDFNIAILVNGNTLGQRTVIGLARTLIHEAIHAEMKRKLISVGYKLDKISFPGIYDYMKRYRQSKNQEWDHEQMAAHYIKTIADALEDFDGGTHSRDFYESLSWEGLQGTTSWDNLSETKRKNIINTIKNNRKNGNKNCS